MPLAANLFCGTSGWSYAHWSGVVYPRVQRRGFHPLQFLARYFDAVEINASFYRPVQAEIAQVWLHMVERNPRFLFAAKLHRRFTHERSMERDEIRSFQRGLAPLLAARKLGAVLMQFPWTFRFTTENRSFLLNLRRAFSDYPLVTEMRHASWMCEEAIGTLIDHKIGFCNIDQAAYTRAMPPTSFVTSPVGYVRLHGRNSDDWKTRQAASLPVARHDYLYCRTELREWEQRIRGVQPFTERTFVFTNNDAAGKSVVNALQLAAMLGDGRGQAPADLLAAYPLDLMEFSSDRPVQRQLYSAGFPALEACPRHAA